jgi:hypothetical protein
MAKQKLTQRLAEVRVSQELFDKIHQVAAMQELDIADVQRLALEDYCAPLDVVKVPVPFVGEIKDNYVFFYPGVKVGGISSDKMLEIAAKQLKEQFEKDRSRYLEVEPVGGGA